MAAHQCQGGSCVIQLKVIFANNFHNSITSLTAVATAIVQNARDGCGRHASHPCYIGNSDSSLCDSTFGNRGRCRFEGLQMLNNPVDVVPDGPCAHSDLTGYLFVSPAIS